MNRLELYKLRPCPACAGAARLERLGWAEYVARCTACPLRTDVRPTPESARMAWNTRPASAARVLTLYELLETEAARMDDGGVQAAWIETRADGAVLAGLISTGFARDLCAAMDIMDADGIWHAVPRRIMREYGHTWRIWSDCPTPAQRAREPWDRELYGDYQFLEDGP